MDMMMASGWEAPADVYYGSGPGTGGACAMLRAYLTANYGRLHRRLAQYLGCPDQASDSLHDAWLHLGQMSLPPSVRYPEAYVYRMACNLAIDRLRREQRGWIPLDDLPEQASPADPQPGPEAVATARSELAALARILDGLPGRQQVVLFDLRIEGRSRTEVASRLGISLRRVDTALRQAMDCCASLAM